MKTSSSKKDGEKVPNFTFHRHFPDDTTSLEVSADIRLGNPQPVEQNHRNIKSRIKPMLGFQSFRTAATTIAGVELMQCIRKRQFVLDVLGISGKTAPEIWNAVLAI